METIRAKVLQLIKQKFGLENLKPDSDLFYFMDSIQILYLANIIKNEFQLNFQPADFSIIQFYSVNEIISFIKKHGTIVEGEK